MDKITTFLYRLFFDREDSLDTLQILFTAIVIIALKVIWRLATAAEEAPEVKIESLVTIRWLVGLLVITAVPKWMIPAMTKVVTKGTFTNSTPIQTQDTYDPPTEQQAP